uniref:Uncharacterized protein n=1 Tax=Angiostrongylus cantonensis TaxID=6313 RepID=A0A0K0D2T9_ANGCA
MYKNGYRISFDGRLVTLFSAPNYMNYKNNSCIVTISERTANQKEKNQKKNINKGDEEEEHSESCGPSPRSSYEQFFSATPLSHTFFQKASPDADRTGPKTNTTAPITNTANKVVGRDRQKNLHQASRVCLNIFPFILQGKL